MGKGKETLGDERVGDLENVCTLVSDGGCYHQVVRVEGSLGVLHSRAEAGIPTQTFVSVPTRTFPRIGLTTHRPGLHPWQGLACFDLLISN